MNPNRQNNCFTPVSAGCTGRQGRPVVIGNPSCCNPAPAQNVAPCCNPTPAQAVVPCCSDVVSGGVIVGGCAEAGCNKETVLAGMPIAMAYVPWQSYGNIYPLQQAIQHGTMFRELNLDFAGRRCN